MHTPVGIVRQRRAKKNPFHLNCYLCLIFIILAATEYTILNFFCAVVVCVFDFARSGPSLIKSQILTVLIGSLCSGCVSFTKSDKIQWSVSSTLPSHQLFRRSDLANEDLGPRCVWLMTQTGYHGMSPPPLPDVTVRQAGDKGSWPYLHPYLQLAVPPSENKSVQGQLKESRWLCFSPKVFV